MSSNSNSIPRKDSLILMLDSQNRSSHNNLVGRSVEVLVVGGGGGGGMDMGGGGGGGEVLCQFYSIVSNSGVAVNIGSGGWGAPAGSGGYRGDGAGPQPSGHQFTISATAGGDTNFGNLTARGGGYGGSSYFGYTPNYGYGSNALAGAGGGGASGYSDGNSGRAGTSASGFSGGSSSGQYYAGGGGGAGGPGKTGQSPSGPPTGGPGLLFPQMSPYHFGGGGGGAAYSTGQGGNGGVGGGGGGANGTTYGGVGFNDGAPGGGGGGGQWANTPGGNAGANTGGGGGGGAHYNANNQGGNGGSGIVIVRYKGTQAATGGTVTYKDGYTYHTFLSGSSFFTPYGTSSTWLDQSKYQNHFTGQGAFTLGEFGSITGFTSNDLGNGNKFQRSSFPSNLKVSQGGNGYTILIWAKSTGGTGSWRKLIGNGDGDNYIDLYQNPSGYWHQDGSAETLYVDGVQVGNDTYYMPSAGWHLYGAINNNGGTLTNPSQALSIGNEPGTSNSYPWYGDIAVVMIYNVVLEAAEMREIYNSQKSRFNIA